jgi:carbonic anhydrase
MRKLLVGIRNFRERIFPKHAHRFRELARAQAPDTLFISCSDSRVVPDLIASADPGDLFTIRNVGNLIPCASADGRSTGDVSEASAIEYAVLVLTVKYIVVCGHSECGAMKAVIAGKTGHGTPNLDQWLCHAHDAAARLASEDPAAAQLKPHDRLSQLNVLAQLEHLSTYEIVRDRIASGTLTLSGWWFDIASGAVHAYDEARQRFEPVGGHSRR